MPLSQTPVSSSLVDSWETFMVPRKEGSEELRHPSSGSTAALQSLYYTTFEHQLSPEDLDPGLQALRASSAALALQDVRLKKKKTSSSLWLLSLVSHNRVLMRTVSQLFLQFNKAFSDTVTAHKATVERLQARQETQLATLLDVGADVSTDMLVSSTVTEKLVLQHQQEMEELLSVCASEEAAVEHELQLQFFHWLNTSAPDAIRALAAKQTEVEGRQRSLPLSGSSQSLAEEWVDLGEGSPLAASPSASGYGQSPLQYKAEVDMSRFTACYGAVTLGGSSRSTADAGGPPTAAPARSVPVRTLALADPNPPPRALMGHKASDAASRAIVVDVSPTSGLRDCLVSCSDPSSPIVAAAAEEHLMRLAHAKHAVLFLIGSEKRAKDLLQSTPSPELLLTGSARCDGAEVFAPVPSEPRLRVAFTTRFWGANVLLLWDPSASADTRSRKESSRSSSARSAQGPSPQRTFLRSNDGGAPMTDTAAMLEEEAAVLVESALRLAFSWNVDMFSMAILPAHSSGITPVTLPAPRAGLPAELTAHAFAFDMLIVLRDAMLRLLAERAYNRTPQLWTVQDEELLSRRYWSETSTSSCPRAVGVRYRGHGSVDERPRKEDVGREDTSAQPSRAPTMGWGFWGSTPNVKGATERSVSLATAAASEKRSSSSSSSPLRGSGTSTAPQVYFNTPMALRVFLPLPEHYFTDTQTCASGAHQGTAPVHGSPHSSRAGSLNLDRGHSTTRSEVLHATKETRAPPAAPTHRIDDSASDEFSNSFAQNLRPGQLSGPQAEAHERALFHRHHEPQHLSFAEVMRYAFGNQVRTY